MKKLLFVLSIFLYSGIWSQTHEANHGKYWYYKHRLKEHFMLVGPDQGESLILSQRRGYFCGNCPTFGDQTLLLGQYIAVLATEYAILAKNDQDTEETLEELFFALHAINRLDGNAQWLYSSGSSSTIWDRPSPIYRTNLNGFFVKDDADKTFFINKFNDHINSNKIKTDNYNVGQHGGWDGKGYSQWTHSWLSLVNGENGQGNEASIDQLYDLLFGLRMVKEFIPMYTTYQGKLFQDGEVHIHREASNIALRLTSWLNHTRMNRTPSNTAAWSMTNGSTYDEVGFQQNGRAWSWATAEVTYDITKDYHGLIIKAKHSGQPAQHNITSFTTGKTVWDGGSKNFFTTPDNTRMALLHGALLGRNNTNIFFKNGYEKYDFFHIPLLRQVLYGGTNPVSTSDYMAILDDAPCDGPRAFKGNDLTLWGKNPITNKVSYEFSTSDRISHPERRKKKYTHRLGPGEPTFPDAEFDGEFPGVDYMLYHNLYYLVHSTDYVNPLNLRNMDIKIPITQNVLDINVLNKITCESEIIPNYSNYITFHAGNEIILKSGFKTNRQNNPNRTFNAKIERIDCSTNVRVYDQSFSPRNSPISSPFRPDSIPHDLSHLKSFNYNESENAEPKRAVFEINTVNDIIAFPNPSESIVNFSIVDAKYLDTKYTVKAYNTSGELISTFEFKNSHSFDLKKYSAGLYFFNFYNHNSKITLVKKIMKK
jgi:hypothetical protein